MSNIHELRLARERRLAQELRLARWERIRQRGVWRFAFVQGMLLCGGSLWLALSIISWSRSTVAGWVHFVLIVAPIAMVLGFGYGAMKYFVTMRMYRRYKDSLS